MRARTITTILLGVIAAMFMAAAPAQATEKQSDTVTIVWEMSGWNGNNPVWTEPQKYVSHEANVGLNATIDAECGYFQVDVYKYESDSDQTKVNHLIKGGVLYGPNNPAEPLISGGLGTAWKFVNLGTCESESPTPTPTPTESTPTPTPTPTESTPTPTPTESSPTPTPTPTESSPTPTPTESTPTSTPSTTPPNDGPPPSTLPRTGGGDEARTLAIWGALAALVGFLIYFSPTLFRRARRH